jgi:hypothetical protein
MTRSLKISLIISILFVGLIRFKPLWVRNPGGLWNLLFYLSMAVLFFLLIIMIISEINSLIKNRKLLKLKSFLPILIMSIFFLDGIFNPLKVDLENMYGEVLFQACYEGTQNQATLKFRKEGTFEIHWTGIFSNEYFSGGYILNRDTILLDFHTVKPRQMGDTLIIKEEYIYRKIADTIISTHFYLGYCKGLN